MMVLSCTLVLFQEGREGWDGYVNGGNVDGSA